MLDFPEENIQESISSITQPTACQAKEALNCTRISKAVQRQPSSNEIKDTFQGIPLH